ncbi:hypothetical protein LJC20_01250 [Eubacteriales bacterium OttesenSCG-928-M02]|nr:hypothetical protein [Eubacteriales bacterium OttesenSCG-928-M02]
MKKVFKKSIMALMAFILLVPTTGFAAGEGGTGVGEETIPVYGYIGEDSEIIDPDPTDPTIPPEKEVYVEVPIKMLFAAFEGDGGAVTAPNYTITNLSTANDVKVSVKNFAQRNGLEVDLDGKLQLDITDETGSPRISGAFPADYTQPKVLAETLSKKTESGTGHILPFSIGGTWSGAFTKDIRPVFDLTLEFTVITPAPAE